MGSLGFQKIIAKEGMTLNQQGEEGLLKTGEWPQICKDLKHTEKSKLGYRESNMRRQHAWEVAMLSWSQ